MSLSTRGATKGLRYTRRRSLDDSSDLSKDASWYLCIVVGLVVYLWCVWGVRVCDVAVCLYTNRCYSCIQMRGFEKKRARRPCAQCKQPPQVNNHLKIWKLTSWNKINVKIGTSLQRWDRYMFFLSKTEFECLTTTTRWMQIASSLQGSVDIGVHLTTTTRSWRANNFVLSNILGCCFFI